MDRLNNLINLFEKTDLLKEQYEEAYSLQEKLRSEEVIISVIGQFKRGKSTLINALLDTSLLPTGIIPLTTVITEIRYGKTLRIQVDFNDGSSREISPVELEDYCSEARNAENHLQVKTVRIQTPAHPFGEGVVLVDTPGVGSVHKHNTESSYDYIKHSDAILFLLSVDSPVSETERDFLLKADQYAGKFYFVVNKTDTVSEEDLHTFLNFCKKVLTKATGIPVTLCPVSARFGDGIPKLRESLLKELHRSGEGIRNAATEKKLTILKAQAAAKLELAFQSLELSTEDLSTSLAHMQERQASLLELADYASAIGQKRTATLIEDIRTQLDQDAVLLKQELNETARKLFEEYKSYSAKKFESSFQIALNNDLRERLSVLNQTGTALLDEGYQNIASYLNGQAEEAARFLARLLKEEFNIDYPVSKKIFLVSRKNDFLFHFGIHGQLLLDKNEVYRMLPGRLVNRKICKRSLAVAYQDVDRNKNNMIYNYQYKMQETFRGFYHELDAFIKNTSKELEVLISHMQKSLDRKDKECESEKSDLQELIRQIRNL